MSTFKLFLLSAFLFALAYGISLLPPIGQEGNLLRQKLAEQGLELRRCLDQKALERTMEQWSKRLLGGE